ncbi:efflux transporter outer membrane subunit [Comamonas sp. w2-DMI]|uniref:Efflux transporter outer membrane subunit n=1 Tax=Comamonas terrae TaxID=673548 RepID=A0ABW5UIN6_9BURK|nr:efflux transporter outer membrane subunit [Comamonas terrae]
MKPAIHVPFARISGWCLGAVALLAGCAAPLPVELDRSVPAHWSQQTADAGRQPAPDLRSWWQAWNDPQLNALVEEALAQNLDVAQAQLRVRQQRLLAGTAHSAYMPGVTAGARTLQDIAAVDSYFHASIDVSWDLGLFGASESAQRSADAGLLDAQAQLHAARVALVADVVHRYLDIRLAQRQRALYAQLGTLDADALRLLQVRRTQRLGSSLAVQQQQLQSSKTAGQLAEVVAAQARAAHGLAALLGRTAPDAAWLAADAQAALPAPQARPPAAVPADMLRTRPDIRSAEAAVERAAADAGIAHAALYPRLTLTGSILYSYNLTQNFRTTSDYMPVFGPQIDIPLFDWGRRRAQADAGELGLQAAIKGYRQSVLNGIADVEASLAAMAAQQERQRQLEQTGTLLQQQVRAQGVRQKLGLDSPLGAMDEQRALLQAQSDMATAQAAQSLAYVALYKALGGAPLDPLLQQTAGGTASAEARQ